MPDQETAFQLAAIVHELIPVLASAERVITHPYEGGHPDHDTAAFAVAAACARLARSLGRASAPDYDFTRPPPPGAALYDRFGWRIESAEWRCEAAQALAALELR